MKLATLNTTVKNIELESLFVSTGKGSLISTGLLAWVNAHKIRQDKGKYSSQVKSYMGDVLDDNILWYSRQSDKDGPYYALWCIDDEACKSDTDKATFNQIMQVCGKLQLA